FTARPVPRAVAYLHLHGAFFVLLKTPEFYTLSLHDALPIYVVILGPCVGERPIHLHFLVPVVVVPAADTGGVGRDHLDPGVGPRSEEHTSELQSRENRVCRLLLEKKDYNNLERLGSLGTGLK